MAFKTNYKERQEFMKSRRKDLRDAERAVLSLHTGCMAAWLSGGPTWRDELETIEHSLRIIREKIGKPRKGAGRGR